MKNSPKPLRFFLPTAIVFSASHWLFHKLATVPRIGGSSNKTVIAHNLTRVPNKTLAIPSKSLTLAIRSKSESVSSQIRAVNGAPGIALPNPAHPMSKDKAGDDTVVVLVAGVVVAPSTTIFSIKASS